jgi:transposase-like protein
MDRPPEPLREELKEWRRAHPQATWDEIEAEVDRRLRQWHADLMEEVASLEVEVPTCPHCAHDMHASGTRRRQIQSQRGPLVTLSRAYYVCPACGTGLFPPG